MKVMLFIASVSHRHGFGAIGGGPTRDDALNALWTWCDQFWESDMLFDIEKPADRDACIKAYFEHVISEQYDISEIEVEI